MRSMKFIGKDSCGYENGCLYLVDTRIQDGYIWAQGRASGCQKVPYSSFDSFLENWEIQRNRREKTMNIKEFTMDSEMMNPFPEKTMGQIIYEVEEREKRKAHRRVLND